jgi:hypothetical protein
MPRRHVMTLRPEQERRLAALHDEQVDVDLRTIFRQAVDRLLEAQERLLAATRTAKLVRRLPSVFTTEGLARRDGRSNGTRWAESVATVDELQLVALLRDADLLEAQHTPGGARVRRRGAFNFGSSTDEGVVLPGSDGIDASVLATWAHGFTEGASAVYDLLRRAQKVEDQLEDLLEQATDCVALGTWNGSDVSAASLLLREAIAVAVVEAESLGLPVPPLLTEQADRSIAPAPRTSYRPIGPSIRPASAP